MIKVKDTFFPCLSEKRFRKWSDPFMEEKKQLEVYFPAKSILWCAVALMVCALLLAVGSQVAEPSTHSSKVAVISPVASYDTLQSLQGAADFSIQTPQALPEGYQVSSYSLIADTTARVVYTNGSERLVYSTASGEGSLYTEDTASYSWNSTVTCGASSVQVSGNEEDVILFASWQRDGISYSLSSTEGLTMESLTALVTSVL